MSQHHAAKWSATEAKKWRGRIAPQLPLPCVDCGYPVLPEQSWQVGHRIPLSQGGTATADNLGPSHSKKSGPNGRSCNQSAGGKLGRDMQTKRTQIVRQEDRRLPEW